ncbi:MAG: ACT domain-containing protein [Verrucomicrobia bacterium]|jgi:glycine cleavage system regulatory protein|nr:ACT domain-containing protein [Verrucomicrobiota bacterium]
MQVPVVMTVIGADRPGIVEAVARVVAEHGGNWLESRMCRLGGQFAGILRAQVPPDRRPALCDALKAMAASGLTIVVEEDEAAPPAPPSGLAVIELVGQDRPGIVREISAALARQRINVEELTTEVVSAPMSGEPLFKARATVTAPADADLAPLRRELEKIAADLQVDIAIHPKTATPG